MKETVDHTNKWETSLIKIGKFVATYGKFCMISLVTETKRILNVVNKEMVGWN